MTKISIKPLLVSLSLLLASTSCLVVERHLKPQKTQSNCHPSQYWDGNQCVHKGQGHGARKHDGDGHPGNGNGKGKGKGKKDK